MQRTPRKAPRLRTVRLSLKGSGFLMDRPEDNEIVVNGQVQEVQWDGCAGAIPDVRNPVSPSGRGLRLQEALNTHRFPNGRDGIYGPFTEALVKKFQESKGLIPDGVAGPATMAALGL